MNKKFRILIFIAKNSDLNETQCSEDKLCIEDSIVVGKEEKLLNGSINNIIYLSYLKITSIISPDFISSIQYNLIILLES